MNALVGDLGLSSWKAIVAALVLPPAPLLLLALIAASLLWARRRAGWWLMTASLVGLWFGCCVVTGDALDAWLLRPPPALGAARIEALRHEARTRQDVAIIVLGAGREIMAPEYGFGSLSAEAIERLRYGAWLAHRTGIPLGFSGGTSYANGSGPSEAQIAARIAAEEFARPLRWREDAARDTRENAARLRGSGARALRDHCRADGARAAHRAAALALAAVEPRLPLRPSRAARGARPARGKLKPLRTSQWGGVSG